MAAYRTVTCKTTELVGQSAAQVRALLGSPDGDWEGKVWYSPKEFCLVQRAKRGGGFERALPAFGLRSSNIPPGQPYRTWEYQRVLPAGTPVPDPTAPTATAHGAPPPPPIRDPSSYWHVYIAVKADGAQVADDDLVLEVRQAPTGAVF